MSKVTTFPFFILMVWTQLWASAAPEVCNKTAIWHDYGSAGIRCCINTTCSPGLVPKICNVSDQPALCADCPKDTFNDRYLQSVPDNDGVPRCKSHTICKENPPQYIKTPGNATHDVECACNDTSWDVDSDGKCVLNCLPGEWLPSNTESCASCANGTYKSVRGRQRCLECTPCNKTATECNTTHDTVCAPDFETEPATENNDGQGLKIGLPVGFLIVAVAVVAIPGFLRWRYGKWCPCTRSSISSSSDDLRRNASNGAESDNEVNIRLLESGSANADSGNTANGTAPSGIRSNAAEPHAVVLEPAHDAVEPHAVVVEPADDAAELHAVVLEPVDGAAEHHAILIEPANNAAEHHGSVDQPASPIQLDAIFGQRDDVDQSSGDRAQPGQASVDPAHPNNFSSGGFVASQEGVLPGLHPGRAPVPASSMCSNVQSPADQLPSQDTHHSSVPQTMPSGQSTVAESCDINLKADPFPADESKLQGYLKTIQNKYNTVQKMFIPDNYFTGFLYSRHILTDEQLTHIRLLHKQPGGKAEALCIVLDALRRVGKRAAEPFLMALLDPDSRQDALALLIDEERANQLIRERDNPADDGTQDADGQNADQRLNSGDVVDYAALASSETSVKVPSSAAPNPNETPLKEIESPDVSEMPVDPIKKADDGKGWVDPPATAPSKPSDDNVSSMT